MPQKKWEKFFDRNGRFYMLPHEDIKKAISKFKENKVLSILEIGCSNGNNLIELAREKFILTGIDFSPSACRIAETWLKEKQLDGKVYVADFHEDLNTFDKGKFDAVVSIKTLHYHKDIKQFEKILSDIHKLIKQDGLLYLVLPSKDTVIIQPDVPQNFYSEEELKTTLSAFFDLEEIYQDSEKSWVIFAKAK